MKLIINDSVIKKCGSSAEYWFSYKDYTIRHIRDFSMDTMPGDMGQSEYGIPLGIIPFVTVSDEEIMRAFIKSRGSAKLNAALGRVKSAQFIDTFWKYFNAYPEFKEEELVAFSKEYIGEKITAWCEENNIEYTYAPTQP